MSWLRDRLFLVVASCVMLGLMVGGGVALERRGLSEWTAVWTYTLVMFVVLVSAGVSELRRRGQKLYRIWPLIATLALFLALHVLAIGWLVIHFGGELKGPYYLITGVAETIVFGLLMQSAYSFCRQKNVKIHT